MAIETQTISADNVIETTERIFAHPDDIAKLDLLNVTAPTDVDYMLNKLNSIQNPIQDRGSFDPTLDGLFPEGAMSGWLYRIVADGTIGTMSMNVGDTIFAVADVVDRTDASLWIKIDNTEEGGLSAGDINTDSTFTAADDNSISSSLAVKTYVDNEILNLSATLMVEIDNAVQASGNYLTATSEFITIALDDVPTNSKITILDLAESVIRIYIEGWGDIVNGWTHFQGSDTILFENDIAHVGKRCMVTYLVKQ